MSSSFYIAGKLFRRQSIIKLLADERAAIEGTGTAVLTRPIEWPVPERTPFMERAQIDPGGTDLWGPGPYLKVPNVRQDDHVELVDRVYCPWGYPPVPLRAFRRKLNMQLERVEITRVGDGAWAWRLTVKAR